MSLYLQAELDDLVASECLYCGDYMIRSVEIPFIEGEEEDQMSNNWS